MKAAPLIGLGIRLVIALVVASFLGKRKAIVPDLGIDSL
jgi:hypothetical protein